MITAPACAKTALPRDVIQMIVRVDDEFHRQLREFLDLGEKLARGAFVLERVDDGDAVISDHKAGVRASFAVGVFDGRQNVVAEWLDGERQGFGGCLLCACGAHKKRKKKRSDDGFAHGSLWYRADEEN